MVFRNRKSIRLQGYDYSRAGAYFITICSYEKEMIFGRVVGDRIDLSDLGVIVYEELIRSTEIRSEIDLDEHEIMPNHIHAIVLITDSGIVGATGGAPTKVAGPRPKSLGSFASGYKSAVTQRCNKTYPQSSRTIWQRNYHDRIIRDDDELEAIRRYIRQNPQAWNRDRHNPNRVVTQDGNGTDFE